MRFLFYDRILELEPGRRAVATKAVSIGDEFLAEHYPRRPLMPATLMLESLAQLAGWLYIVTENFTISAVLGLVQNVTVAGHPRPGDTLVLRAWLQYGHIGGATLSGDVQVDGRIIFHAERLIFASQANRDSASVADARALFGYVSGNFPLAERPSS